MGLRAGCNRTFVYNLLLIEINAIGHLVHLGTIPTHTTTQWSANGSQSTHMCTPTYAVSPGDKVIDVAS